MIFTNRPDADSRSCCVVDFDGVIFNLMCAVEGEVYYRYGTRFKRENILTYDFNKSLDLDMASEDLLEPKKAFGVSREVIFNLMANPSIYNGDYYYKGVVKAIGRLARYIPVVIYSYCLSDTMASAKAVLFENLFKDTNDVFYCTTSNGGTGFKGAYPGARFVIEDSLGNMQEYINQDSSFLRGNPRLFLVDQTYNQVKYNPSYNDVFLHSRRVASATDALERILYRYTNLVASEGA